MKLLDPKLILRAASPQIVTKALRSIDKSTAIVIGICWLAAFTMLILAFIAVKGAILSQKEAASAVASEPIMPVISTSSVTAREIRSVADRLQRQFPGVKFSVGQGQALGIKSDEGAKFHQWISSLSYVDTMSPDYRWMVREFCVGNCGGKGLMQAVIEGQKVSLSRPKQ